MNVRSEPGPGPERARLRDLLTAPRYDSLLEARLARGIHVVALASLTVGPLYAVATLLTGPRPLASFIVVAASVVTAALAWILAERRRLTAGALVLLAGVWGALTYSTLVTGLSSPTTGYYVGLQIIAAILIGQRGAVAITVLLVLSLSGIQLLDEAGLAVGTFAITGRGAWLVQVVLILGNGLLLAFLARDLQRTYQASQAHQAELESVNRALEARSRRDQMLAYVASQALVLESVPELHAAVVGRLADTLGIERVAVLERADEGFRVVAMSGEGTPPPLPTAPLFRALEEKGPVIVAENGDGAVYVPLDGDAVLACLGRAPRPLGGEDVDFVVSVASVLGSAISRRRAELALRLRDEELRQVQKMESVGRLAGGIAHDFNNLLTAILGGSELLLMRKLDPGSVEEVNHILDAARRAESLTRQLLVFSRRQPANIEVLDLRSVVEETERMLSRLISEDIRFTLEVGLDPCWVEADHGQLQQVILNLVVNARDAMPRGGELTVTVRRHLAGGEQRIVLEVCDTGVGMDEATQETMFEPFFTTKPAGRGTGLGLSVVHGAVANCGGTIEVESRPGEGSRFRIAFPEAVGESSAPEDEAPLIGGGHGNETILLVEDELAVRNAARRILEEAGYLVLPAPGGREALERCQTAGHIDLLLTDVVMPNMSGPELAAALVEQRPEIAVLYMSGYAGSAVTDRLGDRKVTLIDKPFDAGSLVAAVRRCLDRRPAPPLAVTR